jgi:hypothetical protein
MVTPSGSRSVLLITSNGFGMGHLVRQLAIKAAMPADVRCTILTLSGAAPIAIEAGATLEYCPSYTRFDKRAWHRGYLADRIEALALEVKADVVLFDGVVPYVGLLTALKRLNVTNVWMRRGVWRESAKTWPLKYSSFFDLVIEPGDIGSLRDRGVTSRGHDATPVGVVTEAGGPALLDREQAAARLGVDPTKRTLLLNIGSNRLADFEAVEQALASRSDWNVISTRDALGRNRSAASGIGVISGIFPLHPYLSAVDLAVTSVGYNAAHEFLATGVPTIVVPADNATDDQYARADAMVEVGASMRVDTSAQLLEALTMLMADAPRRTRMSDSAIAAASRWGSGASEAVGLILSAAPQRNAAMSARSRFAMRLFAERLLGLVSRGDRRSATLTESISMADIRGEDRVEHLHPGLSTAYRARRAEIAASW